MSNIDFKLNIRFDGLDAENHEIDLFLLGSSLQGIARVASITGNFAVTQRYSKRFSSHDIRVLGHEPRANCFSLPIVWDFIQQHQILSGSFGMIVSSLFGYLVSRAANKENVKQLHETLRKAIEDQGNRDGVVIERLLDLVETMVSDMRPSIKKIVSPIGKSAKTITIENEDRSIVSTYDQFDAAVINKADEEDISDLRQLSVLLTELDLERGTAKVRVSGEDTNKRFQALITDPLVEKRNSPYALSFAASSEISIMAKLLTCNGEIKRIFISNINC